jgi:hypothetical protein
MREESGRGGQSTAPFVLDGQKEDIAIGQSYGPKLILTDDGIILAHKRR